MKHSAITELDALRKFDAAQIAEAMEKHLRHDPTKKSQSRIKRLRGLRTPDYRLFHAVDEDGRRVNVLRVMHKDQTASYHEELKR